MKKTALLLVLIGAGRAEIIDRVAAVVGRDVITQGDVEREAQLEAYFGGKAPSGNQKDLLDRLIQQRLILHEMEQTAAPPAEEAEVKQWLQEMRPKDADPKRYGLKEADLVDYARRQVRIAAFVDLRFKPGLQISPADIETYYEKTFLPELKRRRIAETPSLDAVRSRIEQVLIEQRVNQLLDEWLIELRNRIRVKVMEVEKP